MITPPLIRPLQGGLVLTWVDRPEALAALDAEWQDLADRVGADVYMMPDWFAVWWRHFGAGRRLACLIARENGVLVGVLPFCVEPLWAGPWRVRMARLAGTDPHCILFRLPVEDRVAADLLLAALEHLTGPLGCGAVSFTPLSDRSDHLPRLLDLCAQTPQLALHDEPAGSHIVFDLPPDFDSYLGALSKKRRGQFRRDVKGLQDQFAMETTSTVPGATAFAAFVAFHNRQWQAVGRGGHFVDWPGSAAFYQDIAERSAARHWVQLHGQTGSGGPLATQFVLVAGQTGHWRLPARSLDPVAERLSAGKVGLLLMIERLIQQGVTRIEAGRGDYGYKLEYGGHSVAVHRLIVHPATTTARLRLRLLLAWSDILNLLYYRLWFLKLAPRLRKVTGGRPRPLWRSWIRSRL